MDLETMLHKELFLLQFACHMLPLDMDHYFSPCIRFIITQIAIVCLFPRVRFCMFFHIGNIRSQVMTSLAFVNQIFVTCMKNDVFLKIDLFVTCIVTLGTFVGLHCGVRFQVFLHVVVAYLSTHFTSLGLSMGMGFHVKFKKLFR